MDTQVIIIGGGASALMLASLLPKNTATILESNPTFGAKILVSGGGKCNITNICMDTAVGSYLRWMEAAKKWKPPSGSWMRRFYMRDL